MPTPPLPASPVVRVSLDMNDGAGHEYGNRFFLAYSGSAPSGANCATLAGDVAAAWNTDLAPLINGVFALVEVDVLDIATRSGLSGQWTGSHVGTRSGTGVPTQCATNVEFGIARRYRGGKPRMYLPGPVDSDMATGATWTGGFVTAVNSGVSAFFAALGALSVGSMGTLSHVNLSYFEGFTNFLEPSGRERAVPKYRDTALVDTITGYFAKPVISSQRRRRQSTTF